MYSLYIYLRTKTIGSIDKYLFKTETQRRKKLDHQKCLTLILDLYPDIVFLDSSVFGKNNT